MTDDLVERLRHRSETTMDEYLHELTGRAADHITALESALAETLRERSEARAEAENLRADVKAITIALHDAIRRPMGVVPESAEQFYNPAGN